MLKFLEKLFKKNKVEEKTKEEILRKSKETSAKDEFKPDRNEENGSPVETEEKLPLYDENGDVIAEDYFLAEGMEEGDDR